MTPEKRFVGPLVIRSEQMTVLGEASVSSFENRMLRQSAAAYPDQYSEMGETGLRNLIRRVIKTARAHGIDTEGGVAVLLELMILFGEKFERSPERKWANEMLRDPDLPGLLKIRLIRERIMSSTQGRPVVPYSAS